MTPIHRRASLAYKNNDNSRLIRNDQGEVIGWYDVTGQGHYPPVDLQQVSADTAAQLSPTDTQICRGAEVMEPERFAEAACTDSVEDVWVSVIITIAFALLACLAVWARQPSREVVHPYAPAPSGEHRPYQEFDFDEFRKGWMK